MQPRIIICLAFAAVATGSLYPTDVYDEQLVCNVHGMKAELIIMVDRSYSIAPSHFKLLQGFLKALILPLDVSQSTTRVSIISYAQTTTVDCDFQSCNTTASVLRYVDSLSNRRNGGLTKTMDALKAAREKVLPLRRPGMPVYAILLTDGVSNDGSSSATEKTVLEAELLRQHPNVTLIAVGVGSDVNADELQGVTASEEENVFTVDNFHQLDKQLVSGLLQKTCVKPANPCEFNRRYGDVIFVPASQHVSQLNGQLVLKMAETFATSGLVTGGNHLRVGVVPRRCQLNVGYPIDTPVAEIPSITNSKLSTAFLTSADYIRELQENYPPRTDGNAVSTKLAIVVVDHRMSSRQHIDAVASALEAKRNGIVMAVVGVGMQYDREQAEVLASPRMHFQVDDYAKLFTIAHGTLQLNGAPFSQIFELLFKELCVPKKV